MQPKANYMDPEQFSDVLMNVPRLGIRKWKDDDVRMLFRILYFVGLRPTEGITRKKEDFDLQERELYLGQTKTKKEDYAVIPRRFVPELADYLDKKEPGRLWPDLTYNTFYWWTVRLGKMLEIKAWTISQSQSGEKTKGHIFRKSLGKDMFSGRYGEAARNPVIISKQLRHAKPSVTFDHYLKLDAEAVKEAW